MKKQLDGQINLFNFLALEETKEEKKSDKADPCEIGSYDNGCKLRANEEGIT